MSPSFVIVVLPSLYTTAQPDPASQNSTRTTNGTLTGSLGLMGLERELSEQHQRIGTTCRRMKTAPVAMRLARQVPQITQPLP